MKRLSRLILVFCVGSKSLCNKKKFPFKKVFNMKNGNWSEKSIQECEGDTDFCSIDNLDGYSNYSISIRSKNAIGDSPWSKSSEFFTKMRGKLHCYL